tara:strand:+ start:448 stop:1101 length:654 start_codon:yes stop_codon:yes gene_type:complete
MKKFIYLTLLFLLSFNFQERALAGDGMSASSGTNTGSSTYFGISSINFDLDYQSVEGVNLGSFYEEDFSAVEFYIGKSLGANFIEIGYFDTSAETKTLSGTISSITFSGSTTMEFDGIRVGLGRSFMHNNKLNSKLKINYYDIDFDESAAAAVTSGSSTFKATASYSGSSDMLTIGYGLGYMINDKLGLELDYEQSINEPTNIDEVKLLGLNLTYKF